LLIPVSPQVCGEEKSGATGALARLPERPAIGRARSFYEAYRRAMSSLATVTPIAPMLAKPFHRDGWVYAEKCDGW